jgi:flagellar motor switch protein FliM
MSDALNQKDIDSLLQRSAAGGSVTNDSLTQREIDAILQRSTPAPLVQSAPDLQPYNFIRPPRISKDKRATLESIYGRFALGLQALLSSMLRVPTDVVVHAVEQSMFSEFVLSLATPCAAMVFRMGSRFGGEGVLDLSTEFVFHTLDRLFGGPGDAKLPPRTLTALEQAVMRNTGDRMLNLLRDAWSDHFPMHPEFESFESNPDMLQITSREDNVLVASLDIRNPQFTGFVTLCLPMAALDSFLTQDTSARHMGPRSSEHERGLSRRRVESSLRTARLDVRARFPVVWLPAGTVSALAPGQIVHLGHTVGEPVDVVVNGRLRYRGALGQSKGHLGLRVVEPVQQAESDRPIQSRVGRMM